MKNLVCFCALKSALRSALLSTLLFVPMVVSAASFFVSPAGKDTNPGTRAKPFATLERARDEIRTLKSTGRLDRPVEVFLRAGVYELPQTFQLGPEDSGTAAAPVSYRAYGKEKAVLSGGRTVSNWQPYKGRILKANVAAQVKQGVSFQQLFCDGKRQVLARYPNFDPENPIAGGWLYVDGKRVPMNNNITNESRRTFQYKIGELHEWSHPEEVEVMVFPRFNCWNNLIPISSINRSNRVITLASDANYGIRPNDRYYFQNTLEELDSPGEWYLDRRSGALYFWPPADVNSTKVCSPALQTLIKMKGAQFVGFQGLTMECADGTAVILEDCDHCIIGGSTIHNTGSHVIRDLDAGISIRGGTHNGAVGNDIYEVGGAGIQLDGGDRQTLAPAENYADNNHIQHTGVYCKDGVGVTIRGVGNRITHNLIHDCPRLGIFCTGNDHVIEFNHVHHVSLEVEAGRAIYIWQMDWTKRGTEVRYNYCHDVIGFGQTDGQWTFGGGMNWGIYLDDGTSGTHIHGNIVARTVTGGLEIHGGRDNVIENNILIEGRDVQMVFDGYLPEMNQVARLTKTWNEFSGTPAYEKYPGYHELTLSLTNAWQMAGNKFRRNILYYANPKAKLYAAWGPRGNLQVDQTEIDYNLIWHDALPATSWIWWLKPGNLEWSDWKNLGFEQHSIVGDPLFVDPTSDDFRLKPQSPAFALGFKPIPVGKIGLYKDKLRASWPVSATGAGRK